MRRFVSFVTNTAGSFSRSRRSNAVAQRANGAKLVEITRHLARVAAERREIALEVVDLLDHVDRDDDVVVTEAEDRPRVVEQDIRVEDEVLLHSMFARLQTGELRHRS